MAPDRPSRTGGSGLPGMRNSALAAAALTSVAMLSQSADAVPLAGEDAPSREAVRDRVSSLYDRAESDTGQWNFTRPTVTGSRGRGAPAGGGRRSDPDLDNVSRRWFDAARASLGPTIPAILPADRMPAQRTSSPRQAPSRPVRAPEARTGFELEAPGRSVAELPAGGARRPVAELTAGGGTAALPAVPAQRQESAMGAGATGGEPRQASLRTSKEQSQRKIAAASELLYRYTARQTSIPQSAVMSPTAMAEQAAVMPPTAITEQTAVMPSVPMTEQTAVMPSPAMTPQSTVMSPTAMGPQATVMSPMATGPQATVMSPTAATASQTAVMPSMTMAAPQAALAPAPWSEEATRATEEAWRLQQPSVLDTGVPAGEPWSLPLQAGPDMGLSVTDTGAQQQVTALDTGTQWSFQQPTVEATPQQPSVMDTGAWNLSAAADSSLPVSDQWRRLQEPSVLDTGVPEAPAEPPVGTKADRAVSFARAQIGRPCIWGGVGPESYDNSGLTQAAWRAAGVALPRSTHEQASTGTVVPLAESRPGDLIFFNDNFSHVGLYTGNGLMIHAPGPGAVIREESVHYAGEAAIRIAVRPA
ncbi:C40 family peptidase [Streptomyces gilvus]|uniref:C40 family peptidase n=1 Tax=Streptomyces gilvus TaxID=2920937 RepID=UPI0027E4D070|nr:NlpC/P60 family protein [Streptomyces sp. CME 23]